MDHTNQPLVDGLSYRSYEPDDGEKIVELLEMVFNGWPKYDLGCSPLEHWRWKNGGGKNSSLGAVCVHNGCIVGSLQSIPRSIRIGEASLLGSYGVDFAVHPDYKGRGISTRLNNITDGLLKDSGVAFSYAIVGNSILVKAYSKRYPEFPHPMANLVRIRDIDAQLEALPMERPWLVKLGYGVFRLLNVAWRRFYSPESRKTEFKVKRLDRFDERADDLWEEVSVDHDFICDRSADFLNWRYCDPRAGDFIAMMAEGDDGELLGYSVLRVNRYLEGYPVGYIVDLLGRPGRMDVVEALAAESLEYFDTNDVNIVNCLVAKGHPHETALKRLGFVDSMVKIRIFIDEYERKGIFSGIVGSLPSRIHFSWGDHDSLPVKVPG
jgi:GNAT superfamily N-acetyltransferase